MSNTAQQAIELLHPALQNPELAVLAVSTAVGGVAVDVFKKHQEAKLDREQQADALPFADQEVGAAVTQANKRTRRIERLGHYAAIGFASLLLMQEAGPYTTQSDAKGNASIVMNAGNSADVKDMKNSDGIVSRLDASIEGVTQAAEHNAVPFSFVMVGANAQVVDSTPGHHKDLKRTKHRIEAALNPTFRNGQKLADGAEQALPLSGERPNNIILVASNMSNNDESKLRALKLRIKKQYPEDNLYAVVVGQGEGQYSVGNEQLDSPVDPQSFEKVLGADHVQTAQSPDEIEKAITKVTDRIEVTKTKHDMHGYENLAILIGLLGAATAAYRRASGSGIVKSMKSKFNQGRK